MTLELRPRAIDARFRPGTSYVINIPGPSGWLSTRAYTATLGGQALSVAESTDTLIITISSAASLAAGAAGDAALLITNTTTGNVDFVGTWAPSFAGAQWTSVTTTVLIEDIDVAVTIIGSATGGGGGGDVASDAIWDAKGDLAGGTGANTAARLPVGTNGQVLAANSAQATGLEWVAAGSGGAPTTADYLVGTAQGGLSAEIVVGATPGGELGGTWASPTVDASHSGSTHAAAQAAAEATAAADATSKVAAEAVLARNADNLTSGTVADARIASTITRDSEAAAAYQPLDADLTDIAAIADVQGDIIIRGAAGWERLAKSATSTDILQAGASQPVWGPASAPGAHASTHADGGADEVALDGSQITTGTVADVRIASTIARDSEVTALKLSAFAATTSLELLGTISDETGSGALVFGTSPTLVTPLLGTPTSGVLTNATGLPISSGVSGLGAGVATALATPSSANILAAVTDETGTGSLVFATSPTLVTPALGTPASGVLTNATGLPVSTGVAGLGTGVATFLGTPSSANLAAAVTGETGTGALVFATSPALVTPDLGTPSAGVLTNATGLPVGAITGLGSGVATLLATPSSANLATAVTDETGSGALVFGTSPTIATPTLTLKAGTAPTAEGVIEWNTTNNTILVGDGAGTKTFGSDQLEAGIRTTIDTGTPGFLSTDVVLSGGIAGGDALVGGTAASENLILASTAHATQGQVQLLNTSPTYTAAPVPLFGVPSTRTITSNYASQKLPTGIYFAETRVMTTAGNSGGFPNIGFQWGPTYKNANAVAAHLALSASATSTVAFYDSSIVIADGATVNLGVHRSFYSAPYIQGLNSGVWGGGSTYIGFGQLFTVDNITLANATGFQLVNPTLVGTGAITNVRGIDIPVLTAGTTVNTGIRNACTSVKTPTANANITAVTATIAHTAAIITLTADASYTLTSAPTISNGIDGEELLVVNVDTADTITIQDQGTLASSNLRLAAATIALGPRDSIRLVYNGTIGDWVQIGQTNVV